MKSRFTSVVIFCWVTRPRFRVIEPSPNMNMANWLWGNFGDKGNCHYFFGCYCFINTVFVLLFQKKIKSIFLQNKSLRNIFLKNRREDLFFQCGIRALRNSEKIHLVMIILTETTELHFLQN